MPAATFVTAIPAIKGSQTWSLVSTATKTGVKHVSFFQLSLGVAHEQEALLEVLKQIPVRV
jgi:hypothetical protein